MPKEKSIKIKKSDLWKYSTFFLLAVVIILVIMFFRWDCTGQVISGEEAGENLVNFAKEEGIDLEIIKVEDTGNFYEISAIINSYSTSLLMTKDGKYLINGLISIEEETTQPQQTDTNSQTSIPKSTKPVVELFVMAYCPYGTQAEKGIIPAIEVLGDSVDFRMRYVYYVMHGEKEADENLREYCIQENEPEKFLDYMTCFLEGDGVESNGYIIEGNDVDTCLAEAGIDKTELETCMVEADEEFSVTANLEDEDSWLSGYYPLFDVDKELNEEYGIGGSPTLVINGVEVSSARDSASYLNVICSAFTDGNAPEECSEVLSSETPSVYFGWEGTGTSTTAQC